MSAIGKRPTLTRFGQKKTVPGRMVRKGTTKRAVGTREKGRPMRKMVLMRRGR